MYGSISDMITHRLDDALVLALSSLLQCVSQKLDPTSAPFASILKTMTKDVKRKVHARA